MIAVLYFAIVWCVDGYFVKKGYPCLLEPLGIIGCLIFIFIDFPLIRHSAQNGGLIDICKVINAFKLYFL